MRKPTYWSLLAIALLAISGVSHAADEQIAQPAKFISSAPPKYPDTERNADHRGTVKVKLLITISGSVSEAEIAQSSGWPVLDEQTLIAAKNWKFVPAKRSDGTPIESRMQVPVTFSGVSDQQLASDMKESINTMLVKPCRDFLSEVEKQQAETPDKPPYSSVQSFATPWSVALFGLSDGGKNMQSIKILKGRAALFSTVVERCKSSPDESYDVVFKTALRELISQ